MEKIVVERAYIYDLFLRFLHGWNALVTFLLIVTGLYASNIEPGAEQAAIWNLHILFGKGLILGFIGRLIWGWMGPKWARWAELWHADVWVDLVKTRSYRFEDQKYGHEPTASVSYLGFYGLIFGLIFSGLILAAIKHGKGPLASRFYDELDRLTIPHAVHEYGSWLVIGFVVLHIAALAFHEKKDQIPLGQSMISGFQYRKVKGSK